MQKLHLKISFFKNKNAQSPLARLFRGINIADRSYQHINDQGRCYARATAEIRLYVALYRKTFILLWCVFIIYWFMS